MDTYYRDSDLAKFPEVGRNKPELWDKFYDWYSSTTKEGSLTEREKALVGLAVAHTVQCPYCIDAYTTTCLEKGADEEQMNEAVHVAAAMAAGISLVHGVQMMNKIDELMA